jgi:TPR repeat protein
MRIESPGSVALPPAPPVLSHWKSYRMFECRGLALTVLFCLLLCQTSVWAQKGSENLANPDSSGIVERLKSAAEKGDLSAQWELGARYYHGDGVPESYTEAKKWFLKAAEQGDPWAQLTLGNMLHEGQGVQKDYAGAMKWRLRAAEQGHALAQVAQYQIGNMYYFGEGVSQDYALAAKWFRRAAEAGDPQAQFSFAFMCHMGLGVPRNSREAMKWYREAAEQGDAEAQIGLAAKYYDGEGLPKNYAEAAKWYTKAAERGDSWAQRNLALIYKDGHGVPQNNTAAYFWADMSAARGNGEAILLRHGLSRLLPPDQMAHVRKLSAKWRYRSYNLSAGPQTLPSQNQEGSPKPDRELLLISGTAFVVSREGHVLTSYHAIDGCTRIASDLDGKPTSLSVLKTDIANDLAVLKLGSPGPQPFRFLDGKAIALNDAVVVVGYPIQYLPTHQARTARGTVSAMTGPGNDAHIFQLKVVLQPANAGCPLLDAAGNVVGMITAKLDAIRSAELRGDLPQNLNFAVSAATIKTFLDANAVHYESADSKKKLEASQVENLAKKATILIVCLKEDP